VIDGQGRRNNLGNLDADAPHLNHSEALRKTIRAFLPAGRNPHADELLGKIVSMYLGVEMEITWNSSVGQPWISTNGLPRDGLIKTGGFAFCKPDTHTCRIVDYCGRPDSSIRGHAMACNEWPDTPRLPILFIYLTPPLKTKAQWLIHI